MPSLIVQSTLKGRDKQITDCLKHTANHRATVHGETHFVKTQWAIHTKRKKKEKKKKKKI